MDESLNSFQSRNALIDRRSGKPRRLSINGSLPNSIFDHSTASGGRQRAIPSPPVAGKGLFHRLRGRQKAIPPPPAVGKGLRLADHGFHGEPLMQTHEKKKRQKKENKENISSEANESLQE